MASAEPRDSALTVIIPTAGRKDSLRETLAGLAVRTGSERADIVVVDNAPGRELEPADLAIPGLDDAVRLLHEPQPGKAFALNRALRAGVGEIIAVLDDDMAPMPGWMDAVISSARSRPHFDIFSGRSHVVWPEGVERPAWAGHWLAQGVAFSVIDWGPTDREMGVGNVSEPSGNHFWFRRRVLGSVPEFPDLWPPENPFIAAARARGHRGVFVPEVTCGHRLQPELVDARAFLQRAQRFGRAQVDFPPPGASAPRVGRAVPATLRWRARTLVWWMRYQRARLSPEATRVPAQAAANMRMAYYGELIRRSKSSPKPRATGQVRSPASS